MLVIPTGVLETPHAFHVRFSAGSIPISPGQTLKFDLVEMNSGSLYNVNTGIVTIDVPGTYVFFLRVIFLFPFFRRRGGGEGG